MIPHAIAGLKLLAKLPLDIIVVSNQSGIALGIFTRDQMANFNDELRARIESAGARIDAFYFCPHLEPSHLPPEVSPCECSKPSPGMLLEAANDFGIDLSQSFLIGDKTSDIVAGKSVGCTTVLVKTGKAGKEEGALTVDSDYVSDNLYRAALQIHQVYHKSLA